MQRLFHLSRFEICSKYPREVEIEKGFKNVEASVLKVNETMKRLVLMLEQKNKENREKEEEKIKEQERVDKENREREKQARGLKMYDENKKKAINKLFDDYDYLFRCVEDHRISLQKFKKNPALENFYQHTCQFEFSSSNLKQFFDAFIFFFCEKNLGITYDDLEKKEYSRFLSNVYELSSAFIREKELRKSDPERSIDFAYWNNYFFEDYKRDLERIVEDYSRNKDSIIKNYDYQEHKVSSVRSFAIFSENFLLYKNLLVRNKDSEKEVESEFFKEKLEKIIIESKERIVKDLSELKADLKKETEKNQEEIYKLKKELESVEKKLKTEEEEFKALEKDYSSKEIYWKKRDEDSDNIKKLAGQINKNKDELRRQKFERECIERSILKLENSMNIKNIQMRIELTKKLLKETESIDLLINRMWGFNLETNKTMKKIMGNFFEYEFEYNKNKKHKEYVKQLKARFLPANDFYIPEYYRPLAEMGAFRDRVDLSSILSHWNYMQDPELKKFSCIPHCLLYGATGVGKTVAINYLANMLSNYNILYYIKFDSSLDEFSNLMNMIKDFIQYHVVEEYKNHYKKIDLMIILQIDEVDSMALNRDQYNTRESVQSTSNFLTLMDDVNEFNLEKSKWRGIGNCFVQVYGTTNNIGRVDPAVSRPGRLQAMKVESPSKEEKEAYFDEYFQLVDTQLFKFICEFHTDLIYKDSCYYKDKNDFIASPLNLRIQRGDSVTRYLDSNFIQQFESDIESIKEIIFGNRTKIKDEKYCIINDSTNYVEIKAKIDAIVYKDMKKVKECTYKHKIVIDQINSFASINHHANTMKEEYSALKFKESFC